MFSSFSCPLISICDLDMLSLLVVVGVSFIRTWYFTFFLIIVYMSHVQSHLYSVLKNTKCISYHARNVGMEGTLEFI